ncbi:acyl-ACP thioesterase domain-containing protein [Lentilactobacillus raoultii]|uniref:Acyl-ACP thioesterase domain-containing protein n=1 Tax=Lentilactobacillus raoultii TaxID=1987503 RepID=A0ABW3PE06_9LACO|nr:acyl-ACP thioesterase domain-containing protein [Lentilactobacillus raoultii]
MFEKDSEVFLSEVGKDSKIKMGRLIDKFQDVGWLQLQKVLASLPRLNASTVFFATSQQIKIYRDLLLGERIHFRSLFLNANRHKITRKIDILDKKANLLVSQIEDAFFIDFKTKKLASLPQTFPIKMIIDQYEKVSSRKKIRIPDLSRKSVASFKIFDRQLDNYGHMNNARYLDFIDEEPTQIKNLFINYIRPATAGMVLTYERVKVAQEIYYNIRSNEKSIAKVELALK